MTRKRPGSSGLLRAAHWQHLALASITFCVGCAGFSERSPEALSARGTLFLVGGGPQPETLVRRFVDLAGGPGRARIVVLAMASSAGRTSGEEKATQFRGLGADATNLWFDRAGADADTIVARLRSATGIWFAGGDQSRLADVLRGSRSLDAIREAWRDRGAVVGGTSAGAAVMSTPMITGSERRRGGGRYPSDSSEAFLTIERQNVETAEGFAFLTDVVVDQHFVRRRRHNRLMSLVLEAPPHLGAGIDESTALVVLPNGQWVVEGASVVVVYDARGARRRDVGAHGVAAADVLVHVLTAGSRFEPRRGVVVLPP